MAPLVNPVDESRTGRGSRRSSIGSRNDNQDLTARKINRFIRNIKDLRLRLTDEIIEEKSEAVIEEIVDEIETTEDGNKESEDNKKDQDVLSLLNLNNDDIWIIDIL